MRALARGLKDDYSNNVQRHRSGSSGRSRRELRGRERREEAPQAVLRMSGDEEDERRMPREFPVFSVRRRDETMSKEKSEGSAASGEAEAPKLDLSDPAHKACDEKRQAKELCIIEKGELHCGELIEAHKECMRALGFKI
ncbi:unnamed protein product [Lampetra planeri]